MTERLKRLQEANPHIHIYDVHSDEFKQYGTLISKETKEICHLTKSCLEIPAEGSVYQAGSGTSGFFRMGGCASKRIMWWP